MKGELENNKTELNTTFSDNLKELLIEHNKTQTELSKYMGVSSATVSEWCKGKKRPRNDKIEKIARFFGVSPIKLMGWEIYEDKAIKCLDDSAKEKSDFLKAFGKRVKSLRKQKGWTQAELAKRIGFSDHSMISKVESGDSGLLVTTVKDLAEILDTSIAYLVGEDT